MMTRVFIFIDPEKKELYASPQFDGDEVNGILGPHSLLVKELREKMKVMSRIEFKNVCEEVLRRLRHPMPNSAKARENPLVQRIEAGDLLRIHADEFAFILKGNVIVAPYTWNGSLYSLYEITHSSCEIAQLLNSQLYGQEPVQVIYQQKIIIPHAEAEAIRRYLHPASESEFQKEDHTIRHSIRYPDGMQIAVKCCGSREAASWTETVMFDYLGREVCFSDAYDTYERSWELEHRGVIYRAEVCSEGTQTATDESLAEEEEGRCPLCGNLIEYTGKNEIDDDGGMFPWTCPSCGATGEEGYTRVFDRHYNVQAADGDRNQNQDQSEAGAVKMITSLEQLQEALRVKPRLEVLYHWNKDRVGQIRRVTYVDQIGFHSIPVDWRNCEPQLLYSSRGYHLWWGKRGAWRFENGICSIYDSDTAHTIDHLVMAFRVLENREAKNDAGSQ